MSKSFNSITALTQYLQTQINSVLEIEEAKMVKEKIKEHVQEDVYNAYPDPIYYKRRNLQNGSLGDTEEMYSELIQSGTLEVTNLAKPSRPWSMDLDKAIEFGYGDMSQPWNEPRPFIENTREEIQSKNLHVETMRVGLKKRLGSGAVL
ncbi:MAG: hypothetical protein PHO58_05925 [Bacilli bacterium]|nr:hypothetical protein [Bacilli bacterium]